MTLATILSSLASTLPSPSSVNPESVTLGPFTILKNAKTALNGRLIHEIRSGVQSYAHNDSGDNQPFSGDSQWIAMLAGTEWHAINRNLNEVHKLSDTVASGSTLLRNTNTVWHPGINKRYFRLQSNELQLCEVASASPLLTMSLPLTVNDPTNATVTPTYELMAGSQKGGNVGIIVWNNASTEQGVIIFDPNTLALSPVWWIRNALQNGVGSSTALAVQGKLHNIEFGLNGIVGAVMPSGASSDTHQHWIPLDGSTSQNIEPQTSTNPYSHQAYAGQHQITSKLGFMEVSQFPSPPTLSGETTIAQFNETDLRSLAGPTADFTTYQHGHLLANSRGMFSVRSSNNIRAVGLFEYLNPATPTVTPIARDLLNESLGFFGSARPAVSADYSWCCWHQEISGVVFASVCQI